MKIKSIVKSLLNKLPYVSGLYHQTINAAYPNGHFHSPVISIEEVKKRQTEIWSNRNIDGIRGIDLNTDEQKKLVEQFALYYPEIPFTAEKKTDIRYYYNNGFYSYTDAILLYAFIRHFSPTKIIEIGSGFSSAVMLDTNELFFNNQLDLTFIEPIAARLFSLLKEKDKQSIKIMETPVQQISLDVFKSLEPGDILFVDSTHVSKTGSDVNYIVFEILPILKSGVLIHFHDIFYPFEYPKEWVFKGFNWNECYLLKAFLLYNKNFEIKLFADYLHRHHSTVFTDLPLSYLNTGGNLWIEKK